MVQVGSVSEASKSTKHGSIIPVFLIAMASNLIANCMYVFLSEIRTLALGKKRAFLAQSCS